MTLGGLLRNRCGLSEAAEIAQTVDDLHLRSQMGRLQLMRSLESGEAS